MKYTFSSLILVSFIFSLSILFFSSEKSYSQDLHSLTIGNINFDDPTLLGTDALALNAVFLKLPDSVMATNPNSILSGSKAAFSVSAESIPKASRVFDKSITIIDSTGKPFVVGAEISNSSIDFPDDPNTAFLFNTDTIPAEISEGSGSIVIKSNGTSVGIINVFILKSDVLGTDSNDPRNPELKFFKVRKHGNKVRLIIRGRNFYSTDETSFTTIPSSQIEKLLIRSNKKGRSKMIVSFNIADLNQSRVLFSINTPFGQILEKIKLRDPAFRKKK